jgi:hypothetical protein
VDVQLVWQVSQFHLSLQHWGSGHNNQTNNADETETETVAVRKRCRLCAVSLRPVVSCCAGEGDPLRAELDAKLRGPHVLAHLEANRVLLGRKLGENLRSDVVKNWPTISTSADDVMTRR